MDDDLPSKTSIYPPLFEFSHGHRNQKELSELIQSCVDNYQAVEPSVEEKAFLWRATKPNYAPIFIFGTMHEVSLNFEDVFADPLRNILSQVDICFTEVEDLNFVDALNDIPVGAELYQLDTCICVLAFMMGKKLKVLETETVRKIIDQDKYIYTVAFQNVSSVLLNNDTENYLQNILPTLKKGISASTTKRNCFWMYDILQESKNQNASLVVCGGLHNMGKHGLPNLLRFEGYTVTPLMKQAPTPKSKIIKRLLRETKALRFFPPAKNAVQLIEYLENAQTKSASLVP